MIIQHSYLYNIVRYRYSYCLSWLSNAVYFVTVLYPSVALIEETNYIIEKHKRDIGRISDKTGLKVIADSFRFEPDSVFSPKYLHYPETKLGRYKNSTMSSKKISKIIPENLIDKIIMSVKTQYTTDHGTEKRSVDDIASDNTSNDGCLNMNKKHSCDTSDSMACGSQHKKSKLVPISSLEDKDMSPNMEFLSSTISETGSEVCLSDANSLCLLPFANDSVLSADDNFSQLKGMYVGFSLVARYCSA